MDCAVNAQSLISLSLRKIQTSRSQRGGIKLHKNLLVSYVLRNARQVYMSEKYAELYGAPRVAEGLEEEEEEESGAQQLGKAAEPPAPLYPGSSYEPPAAAAAHCSQTTVLDLDTQTVTTVQDGFGQDCACCAAGGRKRKAEPGPGGSAEEASPGKRLRLEEQHWGPSGHWGSPGHWGPSGHWGSPGHSAQGWDCTDSANISNLISMLGWGSRADSEQLLPAEVKANGQCCSKQAVGNLGAWTRAIVAF